MSKFGKPLELNFQLWGGKGNGSTNNTSLFNSAIAYCASQGIGSLYIPKGKYLFSSKPNALTNAVTVRGDGLANTFLVRNYSAGSATEAFMDRQTSYIHFKDLELAAGDGTSSGVALKTVLATSPSTIYGNWCHTHNVRITNDISGSGTGTWAYCLYVDGDDAPGAPSAPGLRDHIYLNCWFFNATTAEIYAKTVRQFEVTGYQAGVFTLTGGDTYVSQNVKLNMLIGGTITAEKTHSLVINGCWQAGTIQSTVEHYNINIVTNAAFTLNSNDGVYASQDALILQGVSK